MFKGGVGTDRSTALADATGSYQIGLVQFSLQYLFNYQDSGSTTLSHNLYLRLTRRFSL